MKFSRRVKLEKVIYYSVTNKKSLDRKPYRSIIEKNNLKNHLASSFLEDNTNVVTSLGYDQRTSTIIVLLCVNSWIV